MPGQTRIWPAAAKVGWSLYGLLGIEKGDRAGSRAKNDRNFDFSGALVGFIIAMIDGLVRAR